MNLYRLSLDVKKKNRYSKNLAVVREYIDKISAISLEVFYRDFLLLRKGSSVFCKGGIVERVEVTKDSLYIHIVTIKDNVTSIKNDIDVLIGVQKAEVCKYEGSYIVCKQIKTSNKGNIPAYTFLQYQISKDGIAVGEIIKRPRKTNGYNYYILGLQETVDDYINEYIAYKEGKRTIEADLEH